MLQKEVFTGIAAGVPGDKATLNPTAYTVHNPIAEGTGVTVGNFVWPGTDVEHQAQVGGSGAPLGIVERLLVYPGACGAGDTTTLELPEGSPLSVVVKGDMYVVTQTAATVGQSVYAVTADGTIKTDSSGQTVSGAVETDWIVKTAGNVGDTIIISNL